MMEHPVHQGSDAWLNLRLGHPTASEFDNLVTPEFKLRTGQMPQTYLCEKLAEHILGKPLESGGSWAMAQGSILEGEAVPFYEFERNVTVRRIGFVTTDDMRIGCSPDGLIDPDGGLECKCPRPDTHVSYLMGGELPAAYRAQVHGCMFVTGRAWWDFISYCRGFPPLIVRASRDEAIQAALKTAVDNFLTRFDTALTTLDAMKIK